MFQKLMILKGLCCILFIFFFANVYGQSTSNRGTDFWIAYAGHIDGTTSRMTLFLSSDVNTTYKVTIGGSVISTGNITANVVSPVFINPTLYNVYIGTSDIKETNKGIQVTSGEPISVYAVLSNNARTGGSLILPTVALEQEYYVFSAQNQGNANISPFSEFTILATKDNTVIDITPSQTSRDGARAANTKFQISLNKGDIYQYQAVNDLTGSHIQAISGCTPIAVFSGNTWVAFCESGNTRAPNGGDNIYQQLFPLTAWGKNFVSSPFYNTLNGNTDMIKIIVSEDNTNINVNGSTTQANGTTLSNPYKKGSVITFYTKDPAVIKANSPIAVAQYQSSQTCNLNNDAQAGKGGSYLGDPEMTILNPIEQTLKDITVYSKLGSVKGVNTNILTYYLNIIIKTADIPGFTLDGQSIGTLFKPIADGEYSYAVVDVTNSTDQHRLMAAGGFTAIAYGYGQVESYAYLAGTDLKNLKSNIQIFKAGASLPSTNFCLGASFDFLMQLPYKTDKITWNFNNGAKIDIINNPTFTNKVVDGVTYYLYQYTLPPAFFANKGHYTISAVIQKPASAVCSQDEQIFTTFDIFAPEIGIPISACVNTDVVFKDISLNTGGNIKSWLWEFGDGKTSTLQNPIHKYQTYGIKTVKLSVVTDMGCNLTTNKTINILASPKSDFEVIPPLCINVPVKFNNLSTFINSDIVKQTWDFGNGQSISTDKSPTSTFTTAGTYKVKLITVSSAGCADTLIKEVVINNPPQIEFDDPGSCVNDVVQFQAKSIEGEINSWFWDFGDGTNDLTQNTRQNPTHKYTSTGVYTIKLIAKASTGCSVVFTRTITISGNNPTSLFALKNGDKICASDSLMVENRSTISFGNITRIDWIYQDLLGGAPVVDTDLKPIIGKIHKHLFPNSSTTKTYRMTMKVYSGKLCYSETGPVSITVYPSPIIKFDSINPVCENAPAFQLQAKEMNGVNGNGVYSGQGVSPQGIFNPAEVGVGTYSIKYTYTSVNTCKEEKTIVIKVNPLPVLTAVDEVDILWGGQKQIDAKVTGNDLEIKWTPSDGLSATNIINPIVSPKTTTKYTLTINSYPCVLVKEILVRVHDEPVIPNVFSPNGDNKNDTWNIKYFETLPQGKISIFNRFGQSVFSAAPYTMPWDGKVNSKEVPVGVYYYIVEPHNGRKNYSGSVTVLR